MSTTWREFLPENAKFPFPDTTRSMYAHSADINPLLVGSIPQNFKAKYAVPDMTLVDKLCQTLDEILGDNPIMGPIPDLLSMFGHRLEFFKPFGGVVTRHTEWSHIGDESKCRILLHAGFLKSAAFCLQVICPGDLLCLVREREMGGRSKVDYAVKLGEDESHFVLIEAKSPSVMTKLSEVLPRSTIALRWMTDESLAPKILQKAAFYLGQWKQEWLFLTSHNDWIVCRLVMDDENPFLAYSPSFSMKNSSVPFRAFLGAILSVHKGIPVPASAPDTGHVVTIPEEDAHYPLPEHDADDGSGPYKDSSKSAILPKVQITRSEMAARGQAPESGLLITCSSPHSPESFQVWVHLWPLPEQALPDNDLAFPIFAENGDSKRRRLWLTDLIGSGSTGAVWQCRPDKSDCSYAIKVVESLCEDDMQRQQRFWKEFRVYLTLEMAYRLKNLRNRITPHFYGAFRDDRNSVLVLGLCNGTLNNWDELDASERAQVYGLVSDLHRVGIIHGDLEPRNIGRVPEHGLCLIDFSESTNHNCVEFMDESGDQLSLQVTRHVCPELQEMRRVLMPLQTCPPISIS